MQERARLGREHAVDVQVVLDEAELRVRAVEVARAVAVDALAQDEVGRARRRANGVELHEPHARHASAIDAERRSERATACARRSRSAERIDDRQARGARGGQESSDEPHEQREAEGRDDDRAA